MKGKEINAAAVAVLLALFAAAMQAFAQAPAASKYITDSQVEADFRGRSFLLVGDDKVAVIRGLNWSPDRSAALPFWFGKGNATPPTLLPKEGKYYVISEAYIVRGLAPNEWLIRAGSSLQKPDAVFITTKTRYKTTGVILPTIVQYIGTRTVTRTDGSKIDLPVLHEVSLPMTWTKGRTPSLYAHYSVKP